MTTALGLLYHLEAIDCRLKAQGDSIHYRGPDGVLTGKLRELFRDHKGELMQMLLSRRKFGYREVGLFRLIDHRVATPQGPGILLSVFRSNCRIELELALTVSTAAPRAAPTDSE